jgi:sulfate/thiosulfate transport system ATP-binding protein
MEVADRIVVINQGRIEQIGSPQEVYRNPASEFVFDFLGTANRFDSPTQSAGVAFARPHETELLFDASARDALPAKVNRVHRGIGQIRVEASLVREHVSNAPHRYVEIHLPQSDRVDERLIEGAPVWIRPTRLHTFPKQLAS